MKQTIAHNGGLAQEETMTPGEVRSIAGVSYQAIHRWCRTGKLHPIAVGNFIGPHGGQMKLFRRSEVMQFLAGRQVKRKRK